MDYIAIVENIKLKNTIKVILREKNQLKKDNAKEKKAIESDPQSKLQNRIPHLNCCWENCGHISPTVVALQEQVSIDHIVTTIKPDTTLEVVHAEGRGCKNTAGVNSKASIKTMGLPYRSQKLCRMPDHHSGRDQNIGRAPPGRRWEATTVRASSSSFTTGSLEKARANGLTLQKIHTDIASLEVRQQDGVRK